MTGARHKFAAQVRKHATLAAHPDRRCVVPVELVPTGHTDALRGPRDGAVAIAGRRRR